MAKKQSLSAEELARISIIQSLTTEELINELSRRLEKGVDDRQQVEMYEAENYSRQINGQS